MIPKKRKTDSLGACNASNVYLLINIGTEAPRSAYAARKLHSEKEVPVQDDVRSSPPTTEGLGFQPANGSRKRRTIFSSFKSTPLEISHHLPSEDNEVESNFELDRNSVVDTPVTLLSTFQPNKNNTLAYSGNCDQVDWTVRLKNGEVCRDRL